MNRATTPILLIVAAALGIFAYFQTRSLQDNQRQVQELSAKLEASHNVANINLQEKCAKRAREEFRDLGWEKAPSADFTNHYNSRLNKCFLLVQNTSGAASEVLEHRTLLDAFERKTFGEYMRSTADGKKFWEAKPFVCNVTLPTGEVTRCTSPDEFEELIKIYME